MRSPTLREIVDIGIDNYNAYINFLAMNVSRYLELADAEAFEEYKGLPDEEKKQFLLFDLITLNDEMIGVYTDTFSFFLSTNVIFNKKERAFLVYEQEQIIGVINTVNFDMVCDYILQFNFLKNSEKPVKCKNKDAQEILDKINAYKKKVQETGKRDSSLEISNIIFKLSSRHNSINILNVWDLTVYQLYAEFYEQIFRYQNDIRAMNYAAYGGDFDISEWYKTNK